MRPWSNIIRKAYAQSQKREREKFVEWLKLGGQTEPDRNTHDGRAAWSQLHAMYEFCRWVESRNAIITEPMPFGLVAADGPEERRWEPEGGLNAEHWLYLKACCGKENAEFTDTCRNEIVEAILTNQLKEKGHSFAVATCAVGRLVVQCDELVGRPLWSVVEELHFEEVVSHLHEEAARINEEFQEQRRQGGESHRSRSGVATRRARGRPSNTQIKVIDDAQDAVTPHWDKDRRELWAGETLIKRFTRPAENQNLILSVFQEEGWPSRIDDPLPPTTNKCGEPLLPKGRLNDVITSLNRNHTMANVIRFRGDGTGQCVVWEWCVRRCLYAVRRSASVVLPHADARINTLVAATGTACARR